MLRLPTGEAAGLIDAVHWDGHWFGVGLSDHCNLKRNFFARKKGVTAFLDRMRGDHGESGKTEQVGGKENCHAVRGMDAILERRDCFLCRGGLASVGGPQQADDGLDIYRFGVDGRERPRVP